MLQEVVGDLKTIVDPFEVVQACDAARISRQGYMAIYNVFVLVFLKIMLQLLLQKLKSFCLAWSCMEVM